MCPCNEVLSNWTNVAVIEDTGTVDDTTGTRLKTTAGGVFMCMPFPSGITMERESTYVLHVKAANRARLMTDAGSGAGAPNITQHHPISHQTSPKVTPNIPSITKYHPITPHLTQNTPLHHWASSYRPQPHGWLRLIPG